MYCVTLDFCEAYASCFIAYWNNSHMGWILSVCARVYVYSVVSFEAQEKMSAVIHSLSPREWSLELWRGLQSSCSHKGVQELGLCVVHQKSWDQIPEHVLHISMCAAVNPRLGIPETLFKMNSGRWHWVCPEEGFVCAMLPVGCGLQKEKEILCRSQLK